MRTVYESPFFSAVHDLSNDVIWIRRHAEPYSSLQAIPQVFEELLRALKPYSKKPAISDLREARGNNNPEWEAVVKPQVRRLYGMFTVIAVLVQTATGKLQTQRLARERGGPGDNVFTDEAAALSYLATHRK